MDLILKIITDRIFHKWNYVTLFHNRVAGLYIQFNATQITTKLFN